MSAVIKLKKEEIEYIEELQIRMQSQNNRLTSFVMFVVFEKEEVVADAERSFDYYTYVENVTGDYCEFKDIAEAKEWIKEYFEITEDNAPEGFDMEEYLEKYIEELAIKEVDKFNQIFFTEQGAKDYIEANSHHLNKPFIYGVSAYDNYELQTVQRYLMNGLSDHKDGVYSK